MALRYCHVSMMCKINKSEIPGEPFFHALFGRYTSFYGHFLVNVGMSEGSTCISSSEIFQGNRGQKNRPCFCGINVMILWKKSLETSFLVFWSFLTKNLAWVTSYQAMYKMFHSWFSLHIFVEKNLSHSFMVVLTIFILWWEKILLS